MTEDKFIKKYAGSWTELENILKSYKKEGFWGISRLDTLYRSASRNLSYAKTNFPRSEIVIYLNGLVAGAHNNLYAGLSEKTGILGFYSKVVPASFRKNILYTLAAALIFFIGFFYSYFYTLIDEANAYAFLPSEIAGSINTEGGEIVWDGAIMSSTIMVNNIRVSILAFGLGITACIGTAYVLLTNGFILGAVAALFTKSPLIFWSLILPHGIIELLAIFISGGAGFMIGMAIIRPGKFKTSDLLTIRGRGAAELIGAVVPMLVIAGIIEGFVTPSSLSPVQKLIFAAATLILLIIYFIPRAKKQVSSHKEFSSDGSVLSLK